MNAIEKELNDFKIDRPTIERMCNDICISSFINWVYEDAFIINEEYMVASIHLRDSLERMIKSYVNSDRFIKDSEPLRNLALQYNFEVELRSAIQAEKLEAYDAFNKKFIVQMDDYDYIRNTAMHLMLNEYKKGTPAHQILLKIPIRFSVVYDGLDGICIPDKPTILDIPPDIFKWLKANVDDNGILASIFNNSLYLDYNFIEAFKKFIKIAKNFKAKNELLGADKNIFQYLKKLYNPIDKLKLNSEYIRNFGDNAYQTLLQNCRNNNINKSTFIYRVLYKDMSTDDATDLGALEKEKYGVGFSNGLTDCTFRVADVLYEVIREHIKVKDKK